jgi:hypothetical protein
VIVTPVKVAGTQVAHLATTTLDGSGADYSAICPAGPMITEPLQLVAEDEGFVWCPACAGWAAAAGVPLPHPPDP